MIKLNQFQDFIVSQIKGGMRFTLVPKELVASRTMITTLLKTNYQDYDLEILPTALFRRNLDLDGELIVTASRTFGAGDKTLKGQPKEGWRHVEMEADQVFMKVLENFTENHRFKLGSDGIQLWGGKRKPDPSQSNNQNRAGGGNNSNTGRSNNNTSKNTRQRGRSRSKAREVPGNGGSSNPQDASATAGAQPPNGAGR